MENAAVLWERFTREGDRQARAELILGYTQLVKYVVGRLAVGMPPSVQYEDLISCGVLGLIEAVDRFNPDKGVKFETYAVTRIRGQVIDSLRALDILPRSVYRHGREIERAAAQLSQKLGRTPTDKEVAHHLGVELARYRGWLVDINFAIVSLDHPLTLKDGEQTTLYSSLEDEKMPIPARQIDDQEMRQELMAAISFLPKREQMMVAMYYNDGLTMKEIGEVLNISESRVSQLHAKIMLGLRGRLKSRFETNPVYDSTGATQASAYAVVT